MKRHQGRLAKLHRCTLVAATLLGSGLATGAASASTEGDIRTAYVALQQATLCANQDRSVRTEMVQFETTRLGELFRDQPEETLNALWDEAEAQLEASNFFESSQATSGPARIRFLSNCRALADGITARIREAERVLRSGAPSVRGIVGSRPGS